MSLLESGEEHYRKAVNNNNKTHTHTHGHTNACTHTHTDACTHTLTHTRAHTRTHSDIHTHTLTLSIQLTSKPDKSEYFLAGLKDGGPSTDPSVRKRIIISRKEILSSREWR